MRWVTISEPRKPDLERKAWTFRVYAGAIVLSKYAEETRETRRHKFQGPCWDSSDERHYHSKLDRPTHIPRDVIEDAILAATCQPYSVYIGWTAKEYEQDDVFIELRKATKP